MPLKKISRRKILQVAGLATTAGLISACKDTPNKKIFTLYFLLFQSCI